MKIKDEAYLLRIFINELEKHKGKLLYEAIIIEAKRLNLKGATVLRGLEGYGGKGYIHSAKLLTLSDNLPVVIEIIDTEQNLSLLFPFLDKNIKEGLVTLEKVKILISRYN